MGKSSDFCGILLVFLLHFYTGVLVFPVKRKKRRPANAGRRKKHRHRLGSSLSAARQSAAVKTISASV